MSIRKKSAGESTSADKHHLFGDPAKPEEILQYLRERPGLLEEYQRMIPPLQQQFLNFCCGASGLRVCYDPFFKHLFNAELYPDRLSELLSAVLGESVQVRQVLPNEGNRFAAESSLLVMDLLQKYLYIPLDVFREILHNKDIETDLEAWLAFLAFDDPEHIWEIQNRFPRFRELYEDMAEFRKDVGEVLRMFSEALAIMDKNTVQYMIEEQQKELEELKKEREEDKKKIAQKDAAHEQDQKEIARLAAELAAIKAQMSGDKK